MLSPRVPNLVPIPGITGSAHCALRPHVSLLSLGIDTRGKSKRLKINYRTSQQILSWTLGILTGQPIDDLDGNIEPEAGAGLLAGGSAVSQAQTLPVVSLGR